MTNRDGGERGRERERGRGGEPTNEQRAGETTAPLCEVKALLAEVAAETEELKRAAGGSITAAIAGWVAGQYLVAAKAELASLPAGPERFALLRRMAGDIAALQRGEQRAARLELDRQRLEFERQRHQEMLAAVEKKMRERPDCFRPLTEAERQAILDKADEVLGLSPEVLPERKAQAQPANNNQ